jgi:DNA-3-methyladenine glycosylase II
VTKTQLDGILIDRVIRKAERHLAKADPIMKRLIARHGRCPLAEREFQPFHMLANSIIGQQFSTKAAAAIKRRLAEIIPPPFVPERFLQIPPNNFVPPACRRAKQATSTIYEMLAECPGIGRWTAEMFLIFGLKRLDVLAVGDAGLQRAARFLYGKKRRSKTLLQRVAQDWRPYRSVASWYLWKSLEDTA